MSDELSILRWLLEGLCGVFMFFISIFVRGHNERIQKIEQDAECIDKDLSNFKLDSEKRFAKEETMQISLARIHDRLDKLPKDIRDMLTGAKIV